MELNRAQQIAENLIRYYIPEYRFKFTHSVRRFGATYTRRNKIHLSQPLTILNTEEKFIDVVLHEIAHTLAPLAEHHGRIWKEIALRIGARPERCYEENTILPPAKYVGVCACGPLFKRNRRMKNAIHRKCKTDVVWKLNK